jgi:hypothetical protein
MRVFRGHILPNRREHIMKSFIVAAVEIFGAAIRAGEAARNHHAPSARDLKILDIPASAFVRG